MQYFMRKRYIILLMFFLTNSLSAYSDQEKIIEKNDSLLSVKNGSEALVAIDNYLLTDGMVSKSLLYNALYLASKKSDTVSVLKYYALGVKYFPEGFPIDKLNNLTDKFDTDRFFGNFNDWFVNLLQLRINYFHVVVLIILSVLIFMGFIFKLSKRKGYNAFFVFSIVLAFVLLWVVNWRVLNTYEKHYVYDSSVELRLSPSYISEVSTESINLGELMVVQEIAEVWVTVVYKNKKYYISCDENPFIF